MFSLFGFSARCLLRPVFSPTLPGGFADALAGMDVVIARGSVPAVRLVPVAPRGRRRFGALKGKIAIDKRFDEPLPDDELTGWNLA